MFRLDVASPSAAAAKLFDQLRSAVVQEDKVTEIQTSRQAACDVISASVASPADAAHAAIVLAYVPLALGLADAFEAMEPTQRELVQKYSLEWTANCFEQVSASDAHHVVYAGTMSWRMDALMFAIAHALLLVNRVAAQLCETATVDTDAVLKDCFRALCDAAGQLQHVRDTQLARLRDAPEADRVLEARESFLLVLSDYCLAEAEACSWRSYVLKSAAATGPVAVKLATSVFVRFRAVLEAARTHQLRADLGWLAYLERRVLLAELTMQRMRCECASAAGEHGQAAALGRATLALCEALERALGARSASAWAVVTSLLGTAAATGAERYAGLPALAARELVAAQAVARKAIEANDTIYFEAVPALELIAAPEPRGIAKALPFCLPEPVALALTIKPASAGSCVAS